MAAIGQANITAIGQADITAIGQADVIVVFDLSDGRPRATRGATCAQNCCSRYGSRMKCATSRSAV
jgi:hypothetical protein